jgi:serine/threonine protein phosphatase PrpC
MKIDDICYICNVGDSRTIMSADKGRKIYELSRDHKPSEEFEQIRIAEGGGKVYQYVYKSKNVELRR